MTRRDCMFLVADTNMAFTVRGMLGRSQFEKSLGCAAFAFDPKQDLVVAAGANDPGLYQRVEGWARGARSTHSHLVVMIDVAWRGSPGAAQIRRALHEGCERAAWPSECVAAVAIEPELENWIWQDSPHVAAAIGYQGPSLRQELAARGAWPLDAAKPQRPKRTLEAELRRAKRQRSSNLYQEIAARVSVKACSDPAFLELRAALQRWFPSAANS